jgi:hypothetical protein
MLFVREQTAITARDSLGWNETRFNDDTAARERNSRSRNSQGVIENPSESFRLIGKRAKTQQA